MRFMVLMIPGIYQKGKVDPNFVPPAEAVEKMGKFNDDLMKAGVMLSAEGLHPLHAGARITYAGGQVKVTDGPFVDAKEVLGGFWMLKANSKEDILNWMKKCPAEPGDVIEIRQIFEEADFQIQSGGKK
jgi:hypothetical protein